MSHRIFIHASKLAFHGMRVSADSLHPNKMPFRGTLLVLDTDSDQPPHGADGHNIFVPEKVAKRRLSGLIGMGLNYDPDLDSHAPRRKVGVITSAWIDDDEVKVKGFVWKKDFPEAVRDLKKGRLGMSMELADVYVRDKDADIWHLEDFHFTGATALYKSAAAYHTTALAAAAAAMGKFALGGDMKKRPTKPQKSVKKRKVAAAAKPNAKTSQANLLAQALGAAVRSAMSPVVKAIKSQSSRIASLAASVEELKAMTVEAEDTEEEETDVLESTNDDMVEEDEDLGAQEEEEEEEVEGEGEEDEEEVEGEGEEDEEEVEGEGDDYDEDEMKSAIEDLEEDAAEEETGEINKGQKPQGAKTSVTINSRARRLRAANLKLKKKLAAAGKKQKKTDRRLAALEAQSERFAEQVGRQTVSGELIHLMEKQGLNIVDMQASGTKMTTGQVDSMLDNAGVNLDPTTRMALKNQLLQANLMEQGEVRR